MITVFCTNLCIRPQNIVRIALCGSKRNANSQKNEKIVPSRKSIKLILSIKIKMQFQDCPQKNYKSPQNEVKLPMHIANIFSLFVSSDLY